MSKQLQQKQYAMYIVKFGHANSVKTIFELLTIDVTTKELGRLHISAMLKLCDIATYKVSSKSAR